MPVNLNNPIIAFSPQNTNNLDMKKRYRNLILLSVILLSFIMHFSFFSRDLMSIHVWRQTQTQSTIVNFYEEDMNILNPHRNNRGNGDGIFRMEFPLMQWLVACTYKVFGEHLVISRLFMFVIAVFSILGMYRMLNAVFRNEALALMGAWAFTFSPSFFYYTINPIPDNLALCCSIWGMALFFEWRMKGKPYQLLVSGFLLGTGALCKLPFILCFIVPVIYFIIQTFENGFSKRNTGNAVIHCSFILLPLAWYITVIPQWKGNGIVMGMLDHHVSFLEYLDYLQHNLVSNLPELLLNYGSVPFFIAGFYFIRKRKAYKHSFFLLFLAWSIAVLGYFLFELNMIGKIHDYYLFPFYPLLFLLVGYGAWNIYSMGSRMARYIVLVLLLVLPLTAWLRMQNRWEPSTPGFNRDLLEYKVELRNAVPGDALCIAGNDESGFIFFYYIDKKGWAFSDDQLSAAEMKRMITEGAKYLYSDSRIIENDSNCRQFLDTLILERGTVRVYRLRSGKGRP